MVLYHGKKRKTSLGCLHNFFSSVCTVLVGCLDHGDLLVDYHIVRYTVKPELTTTWQEGPPVLKDHQISVP